MNDFEPVAIAFAQAQERLRQESETFDQIRRQQQHWFLLRLVTGYASILLLAVLLGFAIIVLSNSDRYPQPVVLSAGGALFADAVGLAVAAWRGFLKGEAAPNLQPVTPAPVLEGAAKTPAGREALERGKRTAPA